MKILIELPSWLGDTVMATPAIENLIEFYDSSEFTIVGSEISIEVLKNHPLVSKTYVVGKNYSSIFSITRELSKFDKFFSEKKTEPMVLQSKPFSLGHSMKLMPRSLVPK